MNEPFPRPRPWMEVALMGVALLLGLTSMALASGLVAPLGTRASITAAELALVAPFALVAQATGSGRLGLRRVPARTLLLSILCGVAFWLASAGLVETQSSAWPPPPEVAGFLERLHGEFRPTGPLGRVGAILTLAVLPAFAEEIAFRGGLLTALLRATSAPTAVAVSAGVFGLIHYAPAGYRIPFALAVGVALGLLRVRTGSVFPGMIAHAVLNTITLTIASDLDAGQPAVAPLGPALALLTVGIALSWLLVRRSRPAPIDPDVVKN